LFTNIVHQVDLWGLSLRACSAIIPWNWAC